MDESKQESISNDITLNDISLNDITTQGEISQVDISQENSQGENTQGENTQGENTQVEYLLIKNFPDEFLLSDYHPESFQAKYFKRHNVPFYKKTTFRKHKKVSP